MNMNSDLMADNSGDAEVQMHAKPFRGLHRQSDRRRGSIIIRKYKILLPVYNIMHTSRQGDWRGHSYLELGACIP